MPKVTINITRRNVYHIAEGISAMISQHNGGTPSHELLWASPDEAKKLDIYYREAISDLERKLTEWIGSASPQHDLTADGTDYTLVINVSPYWPTHLKGLLDNKVQDYLVHAVTAGWLNDFAGLDVKQDYQAMASQDIVDIRSIIYLRAFNFDESERSADGSTKDESDSLNPSERSVDGSVKDNSSVLTPSSRQADTDKDAPLLRPEAGYRRKDNVIKRDNDKKFCLPKNIRHRDNDIVTHDSDWTDWSGSGIALCDHMPVRPVGCGNVATVPYPLASTGCGINQASPLVSCGQGYTPSPLEERPIGCDIAATPPPPHKDPRIPDNPSHPNYPPIYADGIDWSERDLYDAEGSEHGINGKCHK